LNEAIVLAARFSVKVNALILGSSAESVDTNPLKTEFASANDGIFERKHQGWKSLSV